MWLTWTGLIAPDVLPRRNSKFSLVLKVEDCFFKCLHGKVRNNQVKSNFDVQTQKINIRKTLLPYNNGVTKTTQTHVSKLGYQEMDCMQW